MQLDNTCPGLCNVSKAHYSRGSKRCPQDMQRSHGCCYCWYQLLQVVESIAPRSDEVVLPKSSSSVFKSTTLDYMLRNMDKRFLVIAGCSIDQSLAHAVKGAADLGYMVTLVSGELFCIAKV